MTDDIIGNLPDCTLLMPAVAAKYLCIKPNTLGCWRCNGRYKLPYVKVGRVIRYKVGDLKKFVEERTITHTGQKVQDSK